MRGKEFFNFLIRDDVEGEEKGWKKGKRLKLESFCRCTCSINFTDDDIIFWSLSLNKIFKGRGWNFFHWANQKSLKRVAKIK